MNGEGCMDEIGSACLYSRGQSSPAFLSAARWATAEDKVAELLQQIQPSRISDKRRIAITKYMTELIKKHFGYEVFSFGSVPLKTYLSDGDIDLAAFGPYMERTVANHFCTVLQMEEKNVEAQFKVKEVQYINAEVEVVKCLVEDIIVDISFNQLGGLCTLCFLEEVDKRIGQNHLFKRSIILIKAWCYYESRILGAHCSLISTYALETLVLYIFHVFYSSLRGPFEVLFHFLEFFSNFDWDNYGLSLWGPITLTVLQENDFGAAPPNIQGPLGSFLYNCSIEYAAYLEGIDKQRKTFSPKFLNIVDPLRKDNNLGRSVNKGNLCRIRSAFSLGAKQLEKILTGPEEKLCEKLKTFFQSTEKHGSKQDVPVPVSSNESNEQLDMESKLNTGRITGSEPLYYGKKLIPGRCNSDAFQIQELDKEKLEAFLQPLTHIRRGIGNIVVDGNADSELLVEKLYHEAEELGPREGINDVTSKLEKNPLHTSETFHTSKRRGNDAQLKHNVIDFESSELAEFPLNCREQLDNATELARDYCGTCKGNVTGNSLAASNDLRTECSIESSEFKSSCLREIDLQSEEADGSNAKGYFLDEDNFYKNKSENEILTQLMVRDTIQENLCNGFPEPSQECGQKGEDSSQFDQQLHAQVVNDGAYNLERTTTHLSVGSDKFPTPSQESRQKEVDSDQFDQQLHVQVVDGTAYNLERNTTHLSVVSDKCLTGSLETSTFQLNDASSATADQVPDTPAFSGLDDNHIATQHQVFDVCKVDGNHLPTLFQSHLENQLNCERMSFPASSSPSEATFLSQKTVNIHHGFSSPDDLETHSTSDSSVRNLSSPEACLSISNFRTDENILLKSEMVPNSSEKLIQKVKFQELNDDREKDNVRNMIQMNEEQFLCGSDFSCSSRDLIVDLHSSDTETLTSQCQIADKHPDNSEARNYETEIEKDQLEFLRSNVSYESPNYDSEVMSLAASQSQEHSDNFETVNYYYCIPASWFPLKAPVLSFHASPVCSMAPQRISETRNTCGNLEISSKVGEILNVPLSTLQDGAVSEVENSDLQEDILKGDLKTYQYHLQVGHILKSPRLHFVSPIPGIPSYNQGHYFWEGPGRPLTRTNIPSALNHSHIFRSAGVNAHNAFFLRNGHFGEEASRSRTGTRSYFPNLRQNYAGRQSSRPAKCQWDSRSHETAHGDSVRINRRDNNNHEGTHVFVPNYSHSGHGRLHGKGNHRLEKNYYVDAKTREKRWDMPQGQRTQNNSFNNISAMSNGSGPLYLAGGTDANLCFNKKTCLEHVTSIPLTSGAAINTNASGRTFASENLEFMSLGFESRITREETRKGSLLMGCTDGTSSKQQSARQRGQVAEGSSKQKSSSQTPYEMKDEDFPPLSCGHHGRASNFHAEGNTWSSSQ